MDNYVGLAMRLAQKNDYSAVSDALDLAGEIVNSDAAAAHMISAEARRSATAMTKRGGSLKALDLTRRSLLFDAPVNFDCFCRYIEFERDYSKKFYEPRRLQLKRVADALQKLEDDELDLLAISMPPGTGKSTTAIFFLSWLAGKHPEKPILGGSHSNSFLRGVYDECLRVMDKNGEYLWHDVFPDVKVIKTNALDMMIDLARSGNGGKRFATLEFSSIGSGNAGKVRAEQLLYCDDLVSDIEEALSKDRMDKLWQQYTTDLRQRKLDGCKELHIATRWSLHDVIGRLDTAYNENPRAEFIVMPAMNENDESNFDYGNFAGFTTEFYRQQREMMDDASWRALYMNQPIEREGQLYAENELRRYFEKPDGDPDAILAVVDTKDKGIDYCVMPIVYQYGNDFYLEDVICDNSNPEVVESRLAEKLLKHGVDGARFESNAAGGRVAENVQNIIKQNCGKTKITTKYSTANKETRIILAAGFVKDHFLFKDNSVIKQDREYRRFLGMITGYTMSGKNKNDDAPDALSMMVNYIDSFKKNTVEVFRRPF